MTKLTNITAGPKGIHAKDGRLVMIEPGATSDDIELGAGDVNEEWFSTGKATKDAGDSSGAEKPLEQMNKASLLEVATAEGVEKAKDKDGNEIAIAEGTNKEIVAAIKAKREAAAA